MTQKPDCQADSEIQDLFDIRKSGNLDLHKITPVQAAALLEARRLTVQDIHELANHWIDTGLDENSSELIALALNTPETLLDAEHAFQIALREMAVYAPVGDLLVLTVLEVYLDAIVSGRMGSMAGMAALDEFCHANYNTSQKVPKDPIVSHPETSKATGQKYLGQELGLEYMYTWYRELQDAEDCDNSTWYFNELPLHEQLDKFDEQLIEEARKLYIHLASRYPELFRSGQLSPDD